MPHIHPQSALQVIKTFRTQQLKGLTKHLQLFGPLPTPAEAALSCSNTTAEPSIVLPNPFIPRKNPKTGKWRCPKYSLRRQADLMKKAKVTDNLAMMPPGPKLFAMEISKLRLKVVEAGPRFDEARKDCEDSKVEEVQERLWTNPFWAGDVKKKETKGEVLGIKLYAGKKKMFKGHTWEKMKVKRLRRRSILMRDMKARIARYKLYYKKRKPNPLKPSFLSKPRKLPF